MDVKEAVKIAKEYVTDLLSEEGMMNLGLEAVEYDIDREVWKVTVGFSRPWNTTKAGPLATLGGEAPARRAYRVVEVSSPDGKVLSIKRDELVG
mgnify:CR=1 FL=1